MILIGHSMGGLLAKMMAQDSRSYLWELRSPQPFEKLVGPPEDRDLLRQVVFFKSQPEVRWLIFIATPHRGSRLDRGIIRRVGGRLCRLPDPLKQVHQRLLASNGPAFFTPMLRRRLPTSIDQLAWEHPELQALVALGIDPGVTYHSIIADLRDPPLAGGTDGIVPYARRTSMARALSSWSTAAISARPTRSSSGSAGGSSRSISSGSSPGLTDAGAICC